jgi:hypothetical protein
VAVTQLDFLTALCSCCCSYLLNCITTGLLEEILSGAKRAYEGLQRSLDATAAAGSIQDTAATGAGAVPERVCRAIGAFHACNIAVLCLAAVCANTAADSAIRAATSVAPAEVSCACCGRVATTAHMLRCSRCKAVHYCNKEHQQQHWKLHKVRLVGEC